MHNEGEVGKCAVRRLLKHHIRKELVYEYRKSLLTYEQVKLPVLTEEQKKNGLLLPVGVTPGGHLETILLKHELGTDNVCLFGRVGSGKSKALEFIVKALCEMYGKRSYT